MRRSSLCGWTSFAYPHLRLKWTVDAERSFSYCLLGSGKVTLVGLSICLGRRERYTASYSPLLGRTALFSYLCALWSISKSGGGVKYKYGARCELSRFTAVAAEAPASTRKTLSPSLFRLNHLYLALNVRPGN